MYMRVVLNVRKKDVIVLPKNLREATGIDGEDEVMIDVASDKILLRALKPRVVDVDSRIVFELLRKEDSLETKRYREMIYSENVGS